MLPVFLFFFLLTFPAWYTRVRSSEVKELEWRHMGEERASGHGSSRSLDEGKKSSDTHEGGGEKVGPGARTVTGKRVYM